jgi:mycofactocin precursor
MEPIRQIVSSEDKRDQDNPREEEPHILEEIEIEELAIDGICGVY